MKDPALFPTFPSKGAGEKRKNYASPSAPDHHDMGEDEEEIRKQLGVYEGGGGFKLKI